MAKNLYSGRIDAEPLCTGGRSPAPTVSSAAPAPTATVSTSARSTSRMTRLRSEKVCGCRNAASPSGLPLASSPLREEPFSERKRLPLQGGGRAPAMAGRACSLSVTRGLSARQHKGRHPMPEQPKIQFTRRRRRPSPRGAAVCWSRRLPAPARPAYWSSASSGLSPTRSTRWTRTSCSL